MLGDAGGGGGDVAVLSDGSISRGDSEGGVGVTKPQEEMKREVLLLSAAALQPTINWTDVKKGVVVVVVRSHPRER